MQEDAQNKPVRNTTQEKGSLQVANIPDGGTSNKKLMAR